MPVVGLAEARRFSAVLLGFLFLLGLYMFLNSPFFALAEVTAEGHTHFTPEELLTRAGIRFGDSLVHLDVGQAARRLAQDPRVLAARIERRWPNGLHVAVVERIPVAMVAERQGLFLVDRDAVWLGPADATASYPIITGVDPTELDEAAGDVPANLQVGAWIAGLLAAGLAPAVSEIYVGDPEDIVLYTRDVVAVRLGAPVMLADKLELLEVILADSRQKGWRLELIDLRHPRSPVVRQKT